MAYSEQSTKQETLLFLGRDVITAHASKALISKMKAVQEASKISKKELAALDIYNFGWDPYVRINFRQHVQSPDTVPSFASNPNKDKNNKNVIEYLKQMC